MLQEFADRCRDDLTKRVLPFWTAHAIDREFGGVFTCLDRDGSVYDTKKYVWLQGRAAWMFSYLYNTFDPKPEYLDYARSTIEFLRKHAYDDQGRMYFSLTREGKPVFLQRKIYSAVFYMQALLEFYKATQEQDCLDEAVTLFKRILQWKDDPTMLGRPSLSGQPKTGSLADVMVDALMALDLKEVTGEPEYDTYIKQAIEGVKRHYNPDLRILMENVPADGVDGTFSHWPESRFFIPGHSIEVAWFYMKMLDVFPNDGDFQLALDILEGSLEFGWDDEFGGLYYFMDIEGRPTLQLESSMKLWWPHSEAMYALTLACVKTQGEKWLKWLEKVDRYTQSHFPDEKYGAWFGYLDRQGNRTHSCKGGNYKGFYHVPRALLFCWQAIKGSNGAGE